MLTLTQARTAQGRAVGALVEALGQGRLHHAYILSGPLGAPLRGIADALFLSLVCAVAERGGDGCGACAPCRKLVAHNHPDVVALTANDKGIIQVDAVRAVTARLGLRPAEAALTLVRIQPADAMAPAAQNALLKTLEEPPGDTLFLLLAHRPGALLATLRSRCVMLRLTPPAADTVAKQLQEAGIAEALVAPLSALFGADVETATAWQEAGVDGVWQTLTTLVNQNPEPGRVFAVAAELAADKGRYQMSLALLELLVRDALATRHGAKPVVAVASHIGAGLTAAAQALARLRRLQSLHVNRAMALESVLLPLFEGSAVTA